MIQKFIDVWEEKKHTLRESYSKKHPESYKDIFKDLITLIASGHDPDEYYLPDPTRITVIDHGHYQGTLLFIVASQGYQPSDYWYCTVAYGSCSGCDTFQAIIDGCAYDNECPSEKQVEGYMKLALHMLQNLKKMYEDGA